MSGFAKASILLAAVGLSAAALAGERELTGSTDAKGLKSLRLEAHVGSVEITAADGDRISWTLRLVPDDDNAWFSSRKEAQAAVAGAKLRAAAAGDAWELSLELPRGVDFDDVEEHWEVKVPTRFAVEVDGNVGEVRVTGMGGGVDAELNVGDLRVDVPQGDVRARLNVGDLSILSRTKSMGRAVLEANVGSVDLRVDGKRIESAGFMVVGGGVKSDGTGDDDVDARVNVGEVSVRVER